MKPGNNGSNWKVKAKKGKAGALQEIKSLIENYFCDKKTGKFQSGIVYCLSQKECNDTAEKLSSMVHSLTVRPYHAGLSYEERSDTQQAWIQDKVKVYPLRHSIDVNNLNIILQIVCATIAFGMGIDKPG